MPDGTIALSGDDNLALMLDVWIATGKLERRTAPENDAASPSDAVRRIISMDNLLAIAFEAHHDARRITTGTISVTLGRDLLDDWTVAIRYGRAGQGGRELRYASAQPDEIKAVIRDRLRRRLSAPRRIGCPYRLASFSAAPGFDASAWLPGDVMARFFHAA